MRAIPPALAAHLAEGVTTLCRCWRLARRDGAAFGFTDHDRDVGFDGLVHAAGTGLEAAEATQQLGFAVGGGDVSGALVSAGLTEPDILAGLYDDAEVETWLVNWADPAQRLLLGRAAIGEIRRRDGSFVAELRGPMHRLDETRGLTYARGCSADLGDARCRVDLDDPAYSAEGAVAVTDGALSLAADLDLPDGWLAGGKLVWLSGANAGSAVEIKAHRRIGGMAEIELWRRMTGVVAPGDAFRASAGCDKSLATCGAKFGNVANHRGFPHMPGNDFVLKVAAAGGALDGGSLFR